MSNPVSAVVRCERCEARQVRMSDLRSDAAVRCSGCGKVRFTFAEFLQLIRASLNDADGSLAVAAPPRVSAPPAPKAKAARRRP